LLRQLRLRLPEAVPGLQLLAEGILGADSPIDFVGVAGEGRATLVMVGEDDGGLALFARALAQRAWVADRLRDWLQLAPALAIRPESGVGLVLMSPGFSAETRAAARSLGESAPQLVVYRCVRNGAGVEALLEPAAGASQTPAPVPSPAPESAPFRTGLSDADLGLSPAERSEFE